MKKVQQGFTLIELMIVVAIIGILAAIAIPQYQNFIARGQVTEAINLLGGAKTAIEDEVAQTNTFPATSVALDAALGVQVAGKYVDSMAISAASANTGTITATFKSAGVAQGVESTALSFTRNASGVWNCAAAATAGTPNKFLPKTCKL